MLYVPIKFYLFSKFPIRHCAGPSWRYHIISPQDPNSPVSARLCVIRLRIIVRRWVRIIVYISIHHLLVYTSRLYVITLHGGIRYTLIQETRSPNAGYRTRRSIWLLTIGYLYYIILLFYINRHKHIYQFIIISIRHSLYNLVPLRKLLLQYIILELTCCIFTIRCIITIY